MKYLIVQSHSRRAVEATAKGDSSLAAQLLVEARQVIESHSGTDTVEQLGDGSLRVIHRDTRDVVKHFAPGVDHSGPVR